MDEEEGGGKASQIFCLTWVKKGAAKLTPDEITLNPDEIKNVLTNKNSGEINDGDEWEDVEDSGDDSSNANGDQQEEGEPAFEVGVSEAGEDDLKEYNMDDYDDEVGVFGGVSGLVMYTDNCEDPYITKKGNKEEREDSDSEEEEEEKSSIQLQPDDNLLVCARCGQHSSVLEVFVYNHESEDFYVHHDIPLMETPLCMQWVGFDPGIEDGCQGNLLAVGNLNSTIDIWDLDILNTLEPVFSIGKKKKVSKKRKNKDFLHTDAILDLAWTYNAKDQLASASADTIIALWDLELGKSTRKFKGHENKVQTIEWKPESPKKLISGAFDGKILLFDTDTSKSVADWSLRGEVERIVWNVADDNYFAASTDNGLVYYADCRKPMSYLHEWKAHKSAIPGLAVSRVPSSQKAFMLHTASSDGFVKLWDLSQEKPKLIHEKNMNVGMVHCCQTNPDEKYVIACGGQKDSIRLWDLTKTTEVTKYFGIGDNDSSTNACDTLDPLGGAGDDDNEVLEYIEGEDYINHAKLDRLAKQSLNNGRSFGDSNNKQKKRPETNAEIIQGPEQRPVLVEQTEKVKKRRKKKRANKNTGNAVPGGS